MTIKRIQELANFFYSSNNSNDIPLRLSCSTGAFTGFDLSKKDFIDLFIILNKSTNLKIDLNNFLNDR